MPAHTPRRRGTTAYFHGTCLEPVKADSAYVYRIRATRPRGTEPERRRGAGRRMRGRARWAASGQGARLTQTCTLRPLAPCRHGGSGPGKSTSGSPGTPRGQGWHPTPRTAPLLCPALQLGGPAQPRRARSQASSRGWTQTGCLCERTRLCCAPSTPSTAGKMLPEQTFPLTRGPTAAPPVSP